MVQYWRPLSPAAGHGLVLALDFADARVEPGFDRLAALLGDAVPIWELIPVSREPLGGPAYVERIRAGLPGPAGEVRALIGYCAGATLAAELGEAIRREAGDGPPVIMVDPERISADYLLLRFTTSTEVLASAMEPAELDGIANWARSIPADIGVAKLAVTLSDRYAEVVTEGFRRLDLDDGLAKELADRFADFMTYLAVAYDLQGNPWATVPTIITTRELRYLTLPDARRIRLHEVTGGALGEPAVATQIARLLRHDPSGRTAS